MSDTPRTDVAAIEASGHCEDDAEGQAVVTARFARELERELAEAQRSEAAIRELMNCYNVGGWTDSESAMTRELAAERENAELRKALRPFAHFSSGFGRAARHDNWVLVNSPSGIRTITMGDVRAAEDAIRALAAQPKEKT